MIILSHHLYYRPIILSGEDFPWNHAIKPTQRQGCDGRKDPLGLGHPAGPWWSWCPSSGAQKGWNSRYGCGYGWYGWHGWYGCCWNLINLIISKFSTIFSIHSVIYYLLMIFKGLIWSSNDMTWNCLVNLCESCLEADQSVESWQKTLEYVTHSSINQPQLISVYLARLIRLHTHGIASYHICSNLASPG